MIQVAGGSEVGLEKCILISAQIAYCPPTPTMLKRLFPEPLIPPTISLGVRSHDTVRMLSRCAHWAGRTGIRTGTKRVLQRAGWGRRDTYKDSEEICD